MIDNKFKEGDRVRCIGEQYGSTVSIGDIGTITEFHGETLHTFKGYIVDFKTLSGRFMFEREIELAIIPDTKIGRRLYKNQIDKIEDGKIWLK
jgi:hypothetical protein